MKIDQQLKKKDTFATKNIITESNIKVIYLYFILIEFINKINIGNYAWLQQNLTFPE